ncbi:hypothetical protein GS11_1988 [Mycobacterium tuberculosis variant bovis BCG]|nr:hypothetical protein GS11_1988 [Mycobacterium tuberculosis variant bovis BCG]SGO31986.1 Uncharacterised protein [Mycobacterium tuberculosis]
MTAHDWSTVLPSSATIVGNAGTTMVWPVAATSTPNTSAVKIMLRRTGLSSGPPARIAVGAVVGAVGPAISALPSLFESMLELISGARSGIGESSSGHQVGGRETHCAE